MPRKSMRWVLKLLGSLSFFVSIAVFASSSVPTVLLVDKKTNQLFVTHYQGGQYVTDKTYHVTLGQVKGDKEVEGDLKTPEGIYTFKQKLTPPTLKPKFGAMAFYVSYPNAFDQIAGHSGFDIMLHATNEPERLKQNYDSQGCIVVKNEEINEIQNYIRPGLTPLLIFAELTPDFWKPGLDTAYQAFFKSWVKHWESKDLENYINDYHTDFSALDKNKAGWKEYKGLLNKKYASIEISPEDVMVYHHPKYSMITFTQNYRSKLVGGGWGHRSRGTKILYVAEEAGQPKIIAESFTQMMW